MNIQDTIADMLTRIRNAQAASKNEVDVFLTKINNTILKILKDEGFISDYFDSATDPTKTKVILKFYNSRPVIAKIQRVSTPGLRVYKSFKNLPKILNGLGLAIISTSKGMMTDRQARGSRLGGEVILYVY
jgi:small subunit ribosomal protein S8